MHKSLICATKSKGKSYSRRITIPPGYLQDWNKDAGDVIYVDWSDVFQKSKAYEHLIRTTATDTPTELTSAPVQQPSLQSPTHNVRHEQQEATPWKPKIGLKGK